MESWHKGLDPFMVLLVRSGGMLVWIGKKIAEWNSNRWVQIPPIYSASIGIRTRLALFGITVADAWLVGLPVKNLDKAIHLACS